MIKWLVIVATILTVMGCHGNRTLVRYHNPIVYNFTIDPSTVRQDIQQHPQAMGTSTLAFFFSLSLGLTAMGADYMGPPLVTEFRLHGLDDHNKSIEQHNLYWGDNYFVLDGDASHKRWKITVSSPRLHMDTQHFSLPRDRGYHTLTLDLTNNIVTVTKPRHCPHHEDQ